MGSTVEAPLANPELHGLMVRLLHAFLQASISMIGLRFSILAAPSVFLIGNMTSRFHEPGTHPPVRAAFAMSL